MLEHVEYAKPKAVLTLATVLSIPAEFYNDLALLESYFPLVDGTLAHGKDSIPHTWDHTGTCGCGTPQKVLSGESPPAEKYNSCRY